MKNIIVAALLFNVIIVNAQPFSSVDKYALIAPSEALKSIESLSGYLTKNCTDDMEKVRSFYIWITANISYDMNLYLSGERNKEIKAEDVLKSKKSVCQGYAELFKSLCNVAGITCFVIPGYSKGYNYQPGQKLNQSDHAWIAVKINNTWGLIDPTWGAGIIDDNNKYQKKFNPYYFLTPPEKFIYTHLPTDPMWQLLPCPVTLDQFNLDSLKMDLYIKKDTCFNFNDSINSFMQLNANEQLLKTARNAYAFNPDNHDVMGFALIQYAFNMAQNMPDPNVNTDQFIALQKKLLEIYNEAYTVFSKSKTQSARYALEIVKDNQKTVKKNLSQFR